MGICTLELPQDEATTNRRVKLTKRELEVLSLINEGLRSKDVAGELFISKRTVDFHLGSIYIKLSVSNRVKAIRRAIRLGFMPSLQGLRIAA